MSCRCVSQALTPSSARLKKAGVTYVLAFGTCAGCGTVGMEALQQDGRVVLTGAEARLGFQAIGNTPESALSVDAALAPYAFDAENSVLRADDEGPQRRVLEIEVQVKGQVYLHGAVAAVWPGDRYLVVIPALQCCVRARSERDCIERAKRRLELMGGELQVEREWQEQRNFVSKGIKDDESRTEPTPCEGQSGARSSDSYPGGDDHQQMSLF